MITIERIELHHISQPLVHPFRTSMGVEAERVCILVAVYADGVVGWGECPAGMGPWYSSETITTAWHVLSDYLIPSLLGQTITHPTEVPPLLKKVRGHPIAKAGLENAVWDLCAKANGVPLNALFNRPKARERIEVGVSIGIQPSIEALVERVGRFVDLGYGRIKCKIEPGWTVEPLGRIRSTFPNMRVMADANSAFTLDDVAMLKELDALDLLMIEQPLGYDDIADHARLQAQIDTPICLDESIHGVADAQAMIDLQAGRIINMKVTRVGGLTNAIKIHDMVETAGIALWSGGMLETGIGRATNLHMSTLPNFTMPGDISATDRYYAEDIAEPRFTLNTEDSTITVPTGVGIGVEVQLDRVEKARVHHAIHSIE